MYEADHRMKPTIELRVILTESQADRLQRQLSTLPFKVEYQEEQHGASLVVVLLCTPAQEKIVRDILTELGATVPPIDQ
jgi:cell fate (sporulation/competence/biofilm development) regulator YmcA (YheA/YmcA/DUF963 family)